MAAIRSFVRREPVLLIAVLAALVSCIFIPPDAAYLDYMRHRPGCASAQSRPPADKDARAYALASMERLQILYPMGTMQKTSRSEQGK